MYSKVQFSRRSDCDDFSSVVNPLLGDIFTIAIISLVHQLDFPAGDDI